MHVRKWLILCAWSALFHAVFGACANAEDIRVQRGRTFVTVHCAQCHEVGRVGPSSL
jgi:mono/diheme cytochrome c family protein